MSVPENVGCSNEKCIKRDECKRALIYKNNTAVEVKSFGGTPQKGCGKFISPTNILSSTFNKMVLL